MDYHLLDLLFPDSFQLSRLYTYTVGSASFTIRVLTNVIWVDCLLIKLQEVRVK